MELVYLWVEEYKNIYRQGFNFSPKFRCDYDPDTNELTIEENKNYIENFFGENINVTVIVGKNGSGKSSVLELISFLRFERIKQITDKRVICVFQNKENLYIICNTNKGLHSFNCNIEIKNKTKYKIIKNNIDSSDLFELTMFTNGLYDFTMQDENYNIFRTNHFDSFYNGYHIHFKEKQDDKNRHHELNAKYAYILKEKSDFFDFLNEKFLFDYMCLEIDLKRKYELDLYDGDEYYERYKEINNFYNIDFGIKSSWSSFENNEVLEGNKKTELIYKFLSFYFLKEYIYVVSRFERDLNEKYKEHFLKDFLDYIFIPLNDPKVRKEKIIVYMSIITFTKKYFKELNRTLNNVFKDRKGLLDDFKRNTSTLKYVTKFLFLEKILEKNFTIKDFDSYKKNFDLASKNMPIDYTILEDFEKHVKKNSLLTDLYNSNIIRWDFFNQAKNYNYRKLSTGEKQLLDFIVSFAYTIQKMYHSNKSIIFIEEVEISMHPQWQKKLFNIIMNIFKKLDLFNHNTLRYNLIFTTHSPFLLSDIPKQNIIFLDTDEAGNCIVVDGLEGEEKKETFGANIHTLLSDSFFMEDGLMGEFAKGKIEEIIDIFRQDIAIDLQKLNQVENTISIIGEPLLQNRLKKMLISYKKKHDLLSEKEKELIRQIEKLQQQLNEERKK